MCTVFLVIFFYSLSVCDIFIIIIFNELETRASWHPFSQDFTWAVYTSSSLPLAFAIAPFLTIALGAITTRTGKVPPTSNTCVQKRIFSHSIEMEIAFWYKYFLNEKLWFVNRTYFDILTFVDLENSACWLSIFLPRVGHQCCKESKKSSLASSIPTFPRSNRLNSQSQWAWGVQTMLQFLIHLQFYQEHPTLVQCRASKVLELSHFSGGTVKKSPCTIITANKI